MSMQLHFVRETLCENELLFLNRDLDDFIIHRRSETLSDCDRNFETTEEYETTVYRFQILL